MYAETPGDVSGLSDGALAEVVDSFETDRRRALAAEMDVLAVRLERMGSTVRPGDLASELVDRQSVSRRDARRRENVATEWHRMAATATALREGDISFDHTVAMARAAHEHPDRFITEETDLLGEATRRTAGGFTIIIDRWVKANDADNGNDRTRNARRRARVDRYDAGPDMVGLIAEFANLEGHQIWAAIETEARRIWRGDHPLFDESGFDPGADTPSAARYRAAALHSLICGPAAGRGVTTQLIVTATLDNLEHHRGGELLDGTQLSGTDLDRLLCHSPLAGLIFGARGEVLWHGTTVRLATPAQRRAVKTRDRHCTVGTCTVPADQCEIHHLEPFAEGGPTDIDNLALTCPRCHHKIHDHNWTHTGTPGHNLTWHPPAAPTSAAHAHAHNRAPPQAA
ncbi:MAG: DUF222 domain-containing protein [Acidimicrobiales bacterium]